MKGEEPKSFVGEMRNGYGMPFNVNTEGDRPFAEVIGEIVARDLTASGFNVVRGARFSRPRSGRPFVRRKQNEGS